MANDATVDLPAYLERVGHHGDVTPTLETLDALIGAHLRHIPFESIDPMMGIPVEHLDAKSLHDKMIAQRRGGYCYEQNGLFRYVLSAIGFDVELLAGRVVWGRPPGGSIPAETHQLLRVHIPGDTQPYLVDVGFGGQTPTQALRFTTGDRQATDLDPFRIVTCDDDRYLRLDSEVAGRWRPVYLFGDTPRPDIDSVVGSWYVSTHPSHPFRTGLSASIIHDDARWNLRGRHLAIHRPEAASETRDLDTATEVLDLLTERFGIDHSGITGLEARVAEVLDN
ncbi:arylamine N-acetyltransferase family protein [Gordonia sp. NPDC003424]